MLAPRVNRGPIIMAGVVIVFLFTYWHSRDRIPDRTLHYIKGKINSNLHINRPSFYDIAASHGTDKVLGHHYEQMYEHRLAPLRDKRVKMLEIGLGCDMSYGPGASYYTWLEYFTNVDLYYIEYDAACAEAWANKTTEATIFTGDQASVPFLEKFIAEAGTEWDIIIDDGGHTMDQQQVSLSVLWPHIKRGGIYFIEDLATSYHPAYGGGYEERNTMMGDLKSMLDDMNRAGGITQQNPVSKDVWTFEFTQEVVALTKFEGQSVDH